MQSSLPEGFHKLQIREDKNENPMFLPQVFTIIADDHGALILALSSLENEADVHPL